MKKFLLALSFALVAAAAARAQVLRANIESSTVPMGEAFNLNLSYDGKDGANLQPDLSVLQKDFSIYSTSSSSQISYVNGQSSEQRDWDIGLLPKREGEVEIPAISVGKYKTQPLKLKVLPAGSAVAAQPQSGNVQNDNQLAETVKFGVDLAVDLKQPYLQQEINAVLTIDDKVGLQLTDEPQFVNAENWVIKQLKKPELIQQNGERKFKFYYAMFPQTSGKQTIPAAKISGFYMGFDKKLGHPLLEQGVNSLFQLMSVDFDEMFGTQKPVELYTKPIEIDVFPKPENYAANWWLPADSVKIKAIWNEKKPLFKVGETVARQVILLAAGTAETQLPEFDFTDSASFKVYPENPQLESQVYDNKLIAQSITRVVYIPQQGGEQVLPEIRVPWFNVKTKKMEEAIVPAEKIFVEGVAAAEQPAENAKQPDNPLIEEIRNLIDYNGFIEWAQYVENYYGTPRKFVEDEMAKGHDVILEIEVQGAMNVREQYPDAILIFITAPSAKGLRERLAGRGTESEEVIDKRMQRAVEESEDMQQYDYIVVNDDLDTCVHSVHSIIVGRKCLRENNLEFIEEIKNELKAL